MSPLTKIWIFLMILASFHMPDAGKLIGTTGAIFWTVDMLIEHRNKKGE